MLRDRLVCGIKNSQVQRRLLSETDLTFKKAFGLAQASEVAEKNARDLHKPTGAVHIIRTQQPPKKNSPCYHCGGKHSDSMFKVTTGKTRATPLIVSVKVNNKDLQMEVDTGASASVISEETYGRLWKREDAPPLRPTAVLLRTYTGEKLALLGSITVDVQYQEQRRTLSLLWQVRDRRYWVETGYYKSSWTGQT